jgi:hypothetical protein
MAVFDATIDALLPKWPSMPPDCRAVVSRHCANFVRKQIAAAPAHIRFGVYTLFIGFCTFAIFYLGIRPLRSVSRERRAAALRCFTTVLGPTFVALETVLRSMALVAFFEHDYVVTTIGEGQPREQCSCD